MKAREYYVVHDWQEREFVDRVNEFLRLGWEPVGGVALLRDSSMGGAHLGRFAQAMMRHRVVDTAEKPEGR